MRAERWGTNCLKGWTLVDALPLLSENYHYTPSTIDVYPYTFKPFGYRKT